MNFQVYNLCIEKDRIYPKSVFSKNTVGFFPSKDHNPCPIKMILEFCVDITLYLIKNQDSIAAIHCKAGKGRTGVMICSYLIFSNLCSNSEESFEHYAKARTYNCKVYIISQLGTNNCKSETLRSVFRNLPQREFHSSFHTYDP